MKAEDYNLKLGQILLETYGVKDPMEFAPDPADEPTPGFCVCGEKNCADEYAHTTSGY